MSDNAQQLKQASRRGMIWGFLTILFGLFAIGSPFVAGLSAAIFIGIALLAAGITMAIFAFQAPSFGRGILKFLFGLLTIVIGVAIVAEPGIGLAKLTLFLGLYFFFDGFLGLTLGADKHYSTAFSNGVGNEVVGFIEKRKCLVKVDDIDLVAGPKDIRLHFWVPSFGLMTKVQSCNKHLFHCNVSHFILLFVGFFPPSASLPNPTLQGKHRDQVHGRVV